jgi:hypothetical protein
MKNSTFYPTPLVVLRAPCLLLIWGFPWELPSLRLRIIFPWSQSVKEGSLQPLYIFLSQAGKHEITNVVLTALPTFHLSALALPKGVLKQIDKFTKHCLWRGADINSKKAPKVAWEMVCIPKEGGLGVIDLKKHNEALLKKPGQILQS